MRRAQRENFTWNVLVAAKRGDDSGLVSEDNLVVWVWGEEALKEGDCGVENNGSFAPSFDADLHFIVIDDFGADPLDERGRGAREVSRAK